MLDARSLNDERNESPVEVQPMPTRNVLELRVHGVSNTPPQDMLDLPADAIVERGDDLGGFWSPKPKGTDDVTPPGPRGEVPAGVTREAYSWGAFARTSVATPGLGDKLVSVAVRIGWILLMPFGLANVAFWSRIPDQSGDAAIEQRLPTAGHRTMRWFALVLTLIYTLTLFEIIVDLIAVQCLARDHTCVGLPSTLDVARAWAPGQRAAVGLVIVLVVLYLLARLSLSSNVRYEIVVPTGTASSQGDAHLEPRHAGQTHPLSDPAFWARPNSKRHLLSLHMCAASAAVVLTMAVDWNFRAAFATDGRLSGLDTLHRVLWAVVTVAACFVLGYVLVYLTRRHLNTIVAISGDKVGSLTETAAPDRYVAWLTLAMLAVCLAALATQTPVVTHPETASDPRVVTSSVMTSPGPALLMLVALGLALAASTLCLRTSTRWFQLTVCTVSILVVGGLVVTGIWGGATAAFAGALAVAVLVILWHSDADRGIAAATRFAFAGRATAVFLMLSLGFAVLLSSAATLAVGDWLNGCYSAADLKASGVTEPCSTAAQEAAAKAGETPVDLTAPAVFQWAGAFIIPCVLGAVLVVALWLLVNHGREVTAAPRPGGAGDVTTLADRRARARLTAGFLSRGEGLVGLLAAVVFVNLVLAVALAGATEAAHDERNTALAWLLGVGSIATVFLVVTLVGMLVTGASTSNRRPFGLIWDLMCFLPRDGHPLAPPCYAERAVPELTTRILSWLNASDLDTQPAPDASPAEIENARAERSATQAERRVVLSGHSLGGVLCVAAIMQIQHRPDRADLSLLTYGCQLQAYFSRIFPALLGPQVLGVPAVTAAPFWDITKVAGDCGSRWNADAVRARLGGRVQTTALHPSVPTPAGDLVRWRNLYRATDPLGFPVDTARWLLRSEPEKPAQPGELGAIDRGCYEVDTTGYMPKVDTHSDYPRSPEYDAALVTLITP
jgi:hypothetical protein